jgi:hypothetical protein
MEGDEAAPEGLRPVEIPAPPAATAPPAPPAPAPAGPRAAWSAAADPDLALLPAEVAVESPRAWGVIVVHHSATARGSAKVFDAWHRQKGWDGIGYDFVVGNGSDTGDGEIEVTFRWREQREGAHAKGWNDLAVGICLVGNFEETDPTPAQREALVRLVRHLRRRFQVPPERVVGHGSLNPTLCPGKRLDMKRLVVDSDPDAASARRP